MSLLRCLLPEPAERASGWNSEQLAVVKGLVSLAFDGKGEGVWAYYLKLSSPSLAILTVSGVSL